MLHRSQCFVIALLFTLAALFGAQLSPALAASPTVSQAKDAAGAAPQKAASAIAEKININTATAEKLTSVPGIGEKTAASIIEYRTKTGKFKSLDDLVNVKGIGEKSLEKIKPYLSL